MIKRVAMFVGDLKQEYQFRMFDTFTRKAKEEQFDMDIFIVFGIYGSNLLFSYGERNIRKIPDISLYDAILVLSDTFTLNGYEKDLLALFREHPEVPIFSIRNVLEDAYNILVDDYTSMYAMVEHFIKIHHCRRIAFMQGRKDLKDAHVRYQAYLDAMRDNELTVGEYDVFEGDYWKYKAVPALDHFLTQSMPDAIVCANDYMAVSIIEELKNRGYKIPEDTLVSGYDNAIESQIVNPSLTTAEISAEAMCEAFYKALRALKEGETVEHDIYTTSSALYRTSCSCMPETEFQLMNKKTELFETIDRYRTVVSQTTFLFLNLDNAKTFSDVLLTLPIHLGYFKYSGRIFFCFNSGTAVDGPFTDQMILRGIVTSEKCEECYISFNRTEILPKDYDVPIKVVLNLHVKDECFGYLVCEGPLPKSFSFFMQILTENIIAWQERYRITMENHKLSTDSKYDLLTQLPNRKTLDEELNKAYSKMRAGGPNFYICSLDMDGLKEINDHYGHLEGDKALFSIAAILSAEIEERGLIGRLGGDEFMALFYTEDENVIKESVEKIHNDIWKFNSTSDLPYQLSISIGYVKCTPEKLLTAFIQEADFKMYEEKSRKKCSREYKESHGDNS